MVVPSDGGVLVPETQEHWESLGLPGTEHAWLCQESSGDLQDIPEASPSVPLPPTGAVLYQQPVAGWTTKFVGTPSGTAAGFRTLSIDLDIGLGQSFVYLMYASVANFTALKTMFTCGGGWGFQLNNNISNGTPRPSWNLVNVSGTINHGGLNTVHPWMYGRNSSAGTCRLFTDREQINGTFSDVLLPVGASKGIGAASSAEMRVRALYLWRGADAEVVFAKTTLSTLLWPLSY